MNGMSKEKTKSNAPKTVSVRENALPECVNKDLERGAIGIIDLL